jgi:hypothetical protein
MTGAKHNSVRYPIQTAAKPKASGLITASAVGIGPFALPMRLHLYSPNGLELSPFFNDILNPIVFCRGVTGGRASNVSFFLVSIRDPSGSLCSKAFRTLDRFQ